VRQFAPAAFPTEDNRRLVVASSQHVFGEVQAGVGKESRAGHFPEVVNNTCSHFSADAAERPDLTPEIGWALDREVIQVVVG
jgi:hypothetical protein